MIWTYSLAVHDVCFDLVTEQIQNALQVEAFINERTTSNTQVDSITRVERNLIYKKIEVEFQ